MNGFRPRVFTPLLRVITQSTNFFKPEVRVPEFQVQLIAKRVVQSLRVTASAELHKSCAQRRARLDHRLLRRNAQKHSTNSAAAPRVDRLFDPANKDLRLQTDLAQFRNALLFGFVLIQRG